LPAVLGMRSGDLATPHALLNVVDAGHKVRDRVDDVMRSALLHAAKSATALDGLLLVGQGPPGVEREADFVAADGKTDGPHARVEAFLDARDGIVHLHAGLHRGDLEVDGVLQAHVRVGPSRGHIRRAHGGVRLVTLALRIVAVDLHHLAQVAGRRTDLDAALAQRRDYLERAWNERRVLGQTRELKRDEVSEHRVDVILAGRAAVHVLPTAAHRIELGDLLDVHLLVRSHRRTRFVHRDRHLLSLEDLHEHDGGRHAAEVHRRPGPVEQHGFDGTAVGAPV